MTKEKIAKIRARYEAAKDVRKNVKNYHALVTIYDSIEDIPILLSKLNTAKKMCPKGGNDGYITPRPCQCEIESLEVDHDYWKNRAKALERALRTIVPCASCVNQGNDRHCLLGYHAACNCIFEKHKDWQFNQTLFMESGLIQMC